MGKKIVILCLFFSLIIFITSVNAVNISFNNSLITENLTFTGDENITRYLEVPLNTYFKNAFMNVSGFRLDGGYYSGEYADISSIVAYGSYYDLTFNGTNIWAASNINGKAFKLFSNWTDTGDFISFSGVTGITNNNTLIFLSPLAGSQIYKYWMNGTYTGESITKESDNYNSAFLEYDSNILYALDIFYNRLYKYYPNNGTFIEYFNLTETSANGLAIDGTNIWIGDRSSCSVNKYFMNMTYTGESIYFSSQYIPFCGISGIFLNGTDIWIGDATSKVYKFFTNITPSYTSNPYIQINNTKIWNYTGEFNTTEELSDYSNVLNEAINKGSCDCSGCSIVGYNCSIPFIFHSDTAGILNYFLKDFSIISEDTQVFNQTAKETSQQTFFINGSYDSLDYKSISANLNYDGVLYPAVYSGSNGYFEFTTSIQIPSVSSEENKTFYWILKFTELNNDILYFNSTFNNQTIEKVYFHECNSTINTTVLNFTIREEGTFDLLNSSMEATFNYWVSGLEGGEYQTYSFSNTADNQSNYVFCISPSEQIVLIDSTVSYFKTGYDRREYYFDNAIVSNTTDTTYLYLAKTNETDIFTFTLFDEDEDVVTNAEIRILRWDIGTDNFYLVSMIKTDQEGKAFTNLRLTDAWYRYQVIYNNELKLTTEPVKESTNSRILRIQVGLGDPFFQYDFDSLAHSLVFNNASNVFTFNYAETTGGLSYGCLKVLDIKSNKTQVIHLSCVQSTSGTLSYQLTENGTYVAQGIVILTPSYNSIEKIVDEETESFGIPDRFQKIGGHGRFISFILIGTLSAIGVSIGSVFVGCSLVFIGLVFVNLMGWINIGDSVLFAIVSIIIIILIAGGRKT